MMITLTKPTGVEFEVDPDKMELLEPADVGPFGWAPTSKSVFKIGGEMHAVRETIEQIHQLRSKSHGNG